MSAAESLARSLPAPKFEFGTKAETLERLVGVVDNAKIWSLGEAPFPYLYRAAGQAGSASTSFTSPIAVAISRHRP